ncbi:response regulator [Ekhidna sp.]|uniref:response regulator n=1 Tax=Ekhidna sp. TaxID=2608089 RepID=UPI0032EF7B48
MDTLLTHHEQKDKTVLVCDTDYISSTLVSSMIKNRLGSKCYTVSDGRSGAKLISEKKIDLIITEVFLPYMSGITLIETVRNHINMTIPILILSSDVSSQMRESMNDMLVNTFIDKPIHLEELIYHTSLLLQLNKPEKS